MKAGKPTYRELERRLEQARRLIEDLRAGETQMGGSRPAAEGLEQQRQSYRALLDNIPQGISEIDTTGVITFANAAYHKMLGYDDGELLGIPAQDLVVDEDERRGGAALLERLAREQPEPTPYISRDNTKDGRVIDIQVDWDYRRNEKGDVVGFISVISDITRRRRAEEGLECQLAVSNALAELSNALIASPPSIDNIANVVLQHAKDLTESEHGYVSSIAPETGDMVAHTLTAMMGKQCRVTGEARRIIFPAGPAGRYGGLWGHALNTREAFYANSPGAHPASKGLPQGHIPLRNFLSVPAMVGAQLVGQVAVANSARDYTGGDLEAIKRLTELYALAVQRARFEQALMESEAQYRSIVESSPLGILTYELKDGTLVVAAANPAASRILNVDAGRYVGRTMEETFPSLAATETSAVLHRVMEDGAPWSGGELEYEDERINGVYEICAFRTAPDRLVTMFSDVTERRRAEEEIARLAKFPDENPNPVLRIGADGRVLYANKASQAVLEFWQTGVGELLPEKHRRLVSDSLESAENRRRELEVAGRVYSLTYAPGADARHVNLYALDVTERKLFAGYQAVTAQLLERLNRPDLGHRALAMVTGVIKDFAGLEAVGIRLRERDDFPYFVTAGFPAHFVQAESHLCPRDDDGGILRDADGNPILECMCGIVLYGRTDPARPFFTQGGSFWTNSTTALLAGTTDEDRGTHTRNTCNTEGYESVALVPIRADEETVGLLQLNDRRPGRFTPAMIRFLEHVGASIGMAIKRQRAEEALRELNETLEERVAERTAALELRAAQLRALAAELTQAEQRERRRLSWMLHDHLQQLLAAAKFKISSLKHRLRSAELEPSFVQIDDLMQQAIDASRSLAIELSPPILYEAGLAPAIEWLGRQMTEKHGLSVEVEVEERAAPEAEETSVLLFQALRELLFNIVKHAQVKKARVEMAAAGENQLRIAVSDAGVGFDPARSAGGEGGGMGLFSIRERLEMMGGKTEVESAPGKGTRVTLTVPIRRRTQDKKTESPEA